MIRYDFDRTVVEADIRAVDPRWFNKAEKRTKIIVKLGSFAEKTSVWSKIKPTFMRLQKNKCVFCERQFENPDYGTIEFDVEHFRPKSSVVTWPDPVRHSKLKYNFGTGAPYATGYYWLAYELENYAASCKVCNTSLKLNYFPIAGDRGSILATVDDLSNEQPYLCYPFGDLDDDPETLMTFVATTAVPTASDEFKKRRGQTIIDFFDLNGREQLHRERARMIAMCGSALMADAEGEATDQDQLVIARMDSPVLPHSNCLRAFKRSWATDKELARQIYEKCRAYALGGDSSGPPDL
ncbi:hypothetical protein [Agrobacterium sp. MCAB5]|uniref:hypothetical protein n=1 Tax=Agrobacterium sp. MCAB5 TaxID=3233042 RepID=UPI003F92B59E